MNRRAFTLVELLVSMSVGSTLLVLAIGMVHRAMTLETTARGRAATHRTALRLADQFRRDIHHASAVSLPEGSNGNAPAQLRIELPNQEPTTYAATDRGVIRLQQLASEQTRREEFFFPAGYQIDFAELQSPRRAVLTVRRETGLTGYAPRVELHVEAVVGRLQQVAPPVESAP